MELSTLYRECTLNQVSENDIGKERRVAGWVENIRDHGGVSFVDLRDMYGVLQIVMRDTSLLKGINKEDCISVLGKIEKRDEETYNPKIPTGTIELEAHSVEILGKVYRPLPFEIATSKEIREDLRLKYRFLDLRNPKVMSNMIFRSNVIAFLRQKMTGLGFMEVQTPILCASSPEGARDYIVPSRHYKGKFYALPQAPQQYKQLLMVSGVDKYFQIAPCFRDEDARADRSPGEFYQLDMEMAFASQEDVFAVIEDVLPPVFAKYGIYKEASKAPFARISYRDALEKYGSDKPDLRIDLVLQDATEVLADCGFGPFDGQCVEAIVVDQFTATRKVIDKICADVEVQSGQKAYWFKLDENGELVGGIAKFLQERKEAVIEKLGSRKGEFLEMTPVGNRIKMEFLVPSRGLFGYRNEFLTDTKGEGILASVFEKYDVYKGDIARRNTGSLIAFETGEAVAYGIWNAQERGQMFITPGTKVYAGMVVGVCPKSDDVPVNVCRTKHLTNTRASGSDEALRLIPPKQMSLEQCLEFLADDELLEVTPKNLRLRKSILDHSLRMKTLMRNK